MKGAQALDKSKTLKRVFGHEGFRDGQEMIVDEILGGCDVLAVMPTGAGKSICYQLPALMMEGITIVISPLISLMKDQVMALKASGVAAAYINSSLTVWQQGEAIRRAAMGAYKIIYVAPERLDAMEFVKFAQEADISLIAVDEAHCVSQWGQDFRPSYLRIAAFVSSLPKRPPIAAFTATATKHVKHDIAKMLDLNEPYQICTGYNRPNLHFSVVKPTSKLTYLQYFLDKYQDESGIIYCSTRKNVEDVTAQLNGRGMSALGYHAGMPVELRQTNQEAFQFDRVRILVATNAFGMGIDKSNVRYIVHYNMPMNVESYYQEAGRAGRDGEPAECLLLYSGQDIYTAKWLIDKSKEESELAPIQRDAIHDRDMQRLKQITYYANNKSCLRNFILNYFGEFHENEQCGYCSRCDGDEFEIDNGISYVPKNHVLRMIDDAEREAEKHQIKIQRKKDKLNFSSWQMALLDNLKMLRSLLAAKKRAPAYTIFSDASLHDMVRKKPTTLDEFLDVSGVGTTKQERYGKMFLAIIREGKEPNEVLDEFYE